jgi:alpha-L-fucosidase
MNKQEKHLLAAIFLSISVTVLGQHEAQKYFPEDDSLVLEKLEQWQDLKFGLLMHWGAYSQWGIVESWSICPEDYSWCERKKGSNPENYFDYVKEYENLKTTFNPVDFTPERWAKAAKNAGMKYVVFTTKHHDGFSMFDTKQTDYKITDPGCPFHSNPKANITKEIFDAFRSEGMWAGAYFSKPDWNNVNYWDPYFPPRDRNVNYDPDLYPEKWDKFVQFTHNQIMELMTEYGDIDILWLDGGWVAKETREDVVNWHHRKLESSKTGYLKHHMVNQDIRMDELVEKARNAQPGLIVVDRAVQGPNQNYLPPENRVPNKALPYPWESCIIAGGGWSWVPNAKYKSGREAVLLLVDIVAKGGNLLFNIAPGPDGKWHDEAYALLDEMGDWMEINNEAIYGTRAMAPYKEGQVCYTKKDDTVYAIYLSNEGETGLPETITLPSINSDKITSIRLLENGAVLRWTESNQGVMIKIPKSYQKSLVGKYAWVIKIQ